MTDSRSAILRQADQPYVVETVHVADPGHGEVLVRMVGAGMCHTDLFGRSGLLGDHFLPAILGHEGSGVVERVGPGVHSVQAGDHVVLTFGSCGTCTQCVEGEPAYCLTFELRNISGVRPDGTGAVTDSSGAPITSRWFSQSSFGEFAIATERNVVVVDKDVPLEILGPLGCGIQTGAGAVLNDMKLRPGQSLAVFGAGAVGLSAIMAAKLSGASDIVAIDLNAERRALALELGATRAVDGRDADLVAAVRGTGAGMDYSLDTTGVGTVMTASVDVLARRGTSVLVGAGADLFSIVPSSMVGKTVRYIFEGSAIPQLFIPQLVAFWKQGLFPFDRLIKQYPLESINQAEADTMSGATIKPVLSFA